MLIQEVVLQMEGFELGNNIFAMEITTILGLGFFQRFTGRPAYKFLVMRKWCGQRISFENCPSFLETSQRHSYLLVSHSFEFGRPPLFEPNAATSISRSTLYEWTARTVDWIFATSSFRLSGYLNCSGTGDNFP